MWKTIQKKRPFEASSKEISKLENVQNKEINDSI